MIRIQRGNPYTATLYITNRRAPVPLTGYTLLFTLKEKDDFRPDDDNAIAVSSPAILNALEGSVTLSLNSVQTDHEAKTYKADIRVMDVGVPVFSTPMFDVIIENKVTQRTS